MLGTQDPSLAPPPPPRQTAKLKGCTRAPPLCRPACSCTFWTARLPPHRPVCPWVPAASEPARARMPQCAVLSPLQQTPDCPDLLRKIHGPGLQGPQTHGAPRQRARATAPRPQCTGAGPALIPADAPPPPPTPGPLNCPLPGGRAHWHGPASHARWRRVSGTMDSARSRGRRIEPRSEAGSSRAQSGPR